MPPAVPKDAAPNLLLAGFMGTGLRRTSGNHRRPLLKGDDPEARIRDLMKKREQAYLQAGIAVFTDGRSLQQLCVIVERVYEREVRAALKGPGKRRD